MGKALKKYIIFDLETDTLKLIFGSSNYTNAYGQIRRFLEKCGFEHQQGSGYLSVNPISLNKTIAMFQAMEDTFPWLDLCSKTVDVAYVNGIFDLKILSKEVAKDFVIDNSQLELADFDNSFPKVARHTNEQVFRKYLMFDLDTHSLKNVFGESNYTKAYSELENTLKTYGFKHRQGSGYLSSEPFSKNKMALIYDSLSEKLRYVQNL